MSVDLTGVTKYYVVEYEGKDYSVTEMKECNTDTTSHEIHSADGDELTTELESLILDYFEENREDK